MQWHFLLEIQRLYNYLLSKWRKEYDLLLPRNKRFYERVRKIHLRKSGQNLFFRIEEGEIIYGRTIIQPIERAG